MDGRVKTLHPKVHGGLLAIRDNAEHRRADARSTASGRSIFWWSISIRSRRPSRAARDFADCIENIDIGGPAMIRAAAKNHDDVAVVVEPARLRRRARRTRPRMAARRRWRCAAGLPPRPMPAPRPMTRRSRTGSRPNSATAAPRLPRLRRPPDRELLRYGENPHQAAAFYRTPDTRSGRRHRAAGAGQAAVLQQHQRYRRGL